MLCLLVHCIAVRWKIIIIFPLFVYSCIYVQSYTFLFFFSQFSWNVKTLRKIFRARAQQFEGSLHGKATYITTWNDIQPVCSLIRPFYARIIWILDFFIFFLWKFFRPAVFIIVINVLIIAVQLDSFMHSSNFNENTLDMMHGFIFFVNKFQILQSTPSTHSLRREMPSK